MTPSNYNYPDAEGHFGPYGGRYVGETLMPALLELDEAYHRAIKDEAFLAEFADLLANYVGRPSPTYLARRLTEHVGGAQIYLKREDLNHSGAHKVNNTVGQALLAKFMGKRRLIAETGAGQHGVATATVAALLGMDCKVFMGAEDIQRQAPNVKRYSYAQGRDERSPAILVCRRSGYVLRHRHRGRPGTVSGDGAFLPAYHRR